jgi:peroxiredoxin
MCRMLTILLLALLAGPVFAAPLLQIGDPFPEVPMPTPADQAARQYLGLPAAATFTLSQVPGEVVLVEILNVLCPHCQRQTKPYNELYRRLQADPATRGRVRMLGVAVGNSPEQIDDFVTVYGVLFPVVADSQFHIHRATGGSRTPFSIYVRQNPAGGAGVVAGTQLGEDPAFDDLFAFLKDVAGMAPADFSSLAGSEAPEQVKVAPFLPPAELQKRVRQVLAARGPLSGLERVELPGERQVFTALAGPPARQERFFAEVVSRASICDVCHDVHFIYVFDTRGRVVDFVPLHLTKYGNLEWNDAEVEKMRRRVVGQYLRAPRPFDPQLDAVTRATMTSAIIFDQLARGEELMDQLQQRGLLQ